MLAMMLMALHDEGKQDAADAEDREQGRAEDHRADIFCRRRFKNIRATTGAVTDVVAYQVRDHSRVAWVVFRDAGLRLCRPESAPTSAAFV